MMYQAAVPGEGAVKRITQNADPNAAKQTVLKGLTSGDTPLVTSFRWNLCFIQISCFNNVPVTK